MRRIIFFAIVFIAFQYFAGAAETQDSGRPTYLSLALKLQPKGISTDETYGYSKNNPIKVGGARENAGPLSERIYLYMLKGPGGQRIRFTRRGSCCPFSSPNGFNGTGLLDIYIITYEGATKPIVLYINMYDYEPTMAPVGFTYIQRRQQQNAY